MRLEEPRRMQLHRLARLRIGHIPIQELGHILDGIGAIGGLLHHRKGCRRRRIGRQLRPRQPRLHQDQLLRKHKHHPLRARLVAKDRFRLLTLFCLLE